jgi:magnesium-transporting ATPase (P-type)
MKRILIVGAGFAACMQPCPPRACATSNERHGLGDEAARDRLAQYGPNELAAHEAVPAWRRFL